jgi:hypothetical protein
VNSRHTIAAFKPCRRVDNEEHVNKCVKVMLIDTDGVTRYCASAFACIVLSLDHSPAPWFINNRPEKPDDLPNARRNGRSQGSSPEKPGIQAYVLLAPELGSSRQVGQILVLG